LRVLVIGDVIGRPGRRAVEALLPNLRKEHQIDLVLANGENAAGGIGLTPATAEELFRSGVDVITSGNHIWHYKEIIPYLEGDYPVLRPLNFPPGVPGRGYVYVKGALIVNLMGRVFMSAIDCPFRAMDQLLESIGSGPKIIVVDFHAEATSEKNALAKYLDGRVSLVAGTHTHIGTIDARILPQGTAFVTDVGMVGPEDSVIGDDAQAAISRFLTGMPHRLSVGQGPVTFNSILAEIEPGGRALEIRRIDLRFV